MNKPLISMSELQSMIKRRKTLAIAVAVGVAGCSMAGPHTATPAPDAEGKTVADGMVRDYTSDIEKALDKVDRDRLSAARQAGQPPQLKPSKTEVFKNIAATLDDKQIAAGPAEHDAPAAHAPAAPAHPPAPVKETTPLTKESSGHAEPAPKPPLARVESPAPAAAHDAPVVDAHPAEAVKAPAAEAPVAKPPVATVAPMSSTVVSPDERSPAETPAVKTGTPAASAMGSMTAMLGAPSAHVDIPEHVTTAEPSLDDALATLRKSIGSHPTLNTALALALLDGNKTPDGDMTKMLSDSDQKVLTDLVAALDVMKGAQASPAAVVSQRAAPLVDAAKKWQAESDLSLPCLSLATRVDSYGVFTAVSPTFEQGRRHTVIIYCEVANFGAKKGDDGWFTTRLTQQESLITEDKLLVWRPNAEEVEDRSLNQRHDFYLVKKFTLPDTLAAGKYTLRMDVTDANTGKRAVQSMEIQIVSK